MNKPNTYNFLFVKLRILWHLMFWCIAFIILLKIFSLSTNIETIDLIYTGILIIPISIAVYCNLYLLIPILLRKEHYLLFLLAEALIIFLSAGFIYLLFDRWIDIIIKNYYFISSEKLNVWISYSAVFVILSTLLKLSKEWIIYLREDRQNNIHQLKNLQAQINPHFLLNSLQTIYSLSLNNSEKTPETVLQLSEILKFSLYETSQSQVDLQREIEVMEDYIEMYRLRLDPIKATISLQVIGSAEEEKIVPLLFLPFIENSFKHGLQGSDKKAFIKISFEIEAYKISFTIENSQGKFNEVEKADFGGIGIENTRKRLQLSYPDKHHLTIDDKTDTFTVKLSIDLS